MEPTDRLPNETDEQFDIRINKDIAAFSYLWIMSVVVYFAKKHSPFARFHAKQGIVLFLFSIPMSLIPVVGKIGLFFIVAGMLLGFVHAAQGQYADLPIVGDLAKGNLSMTELAQRTFRSLRQGIDALEKLFHRFASKEKEKPMDTNKEHDVI